MMRPIATTAALVAALLSGCGSDGPELVPVTGVVTLDGKPLEGAAVTFAPAPTNAVLTPGGAFTGPDGSFTARYNERDGLAPGSYKVLVSKTTTKDGKPVPEAFKDDPAMAAISGFMAESLPPDYGNANTSPLSLEVDEEGGEYAFDVKSASPKKK